MELRARLAYGIPILLLSALCLLLYVPVLVILSVDKEFRKVSAYIIMTHIGVLDAFQLIIHLYSGTLVVAHVHLRFCIDKVVGAILAGLWFSCLAFTLLLTFNRLATILLQRWFPQLISTKFTCVLFALCYMCFIVPFILGLRPYANYIFDPDTFAWNHLSTDSYVSVVLSNIGNYLVLAVVVLSIVAYTSIFTYIGFIRSSKLSKREYRITMQVSVLALFWLFSFVYWTYLLPLFGGSLVSYFVSYLIWVLMNGIHPIIYLVFNDKLRYSFVQLIFHRKMPHNSSIVTRVS